MERPDGKVQELPLWMTEAHVCEQMTLGPPEVSVDALRSLQDFLESTLANDDTASSSRNHRSKGGLP